MHTDTHQSVITVKKSLIFTIFKTRVWLSPTAVNFCAFLKTFHIIHSSNFSKKTVVLLNLKSLFYK